jgi:hypothetical protein
MISTTRGGNAVNCYLVWDEVSREAALFDTGWEATPILQFVADNELELRHLFLTHMHQDHVAAMDDLRARFPKLHLHTNFRNAPPQHRNRANDFIQLGSLRITNRATPGMRRRAWLISSATGRKTRRTSPWWEIQSSPAPSPPVRVLGDAEGSNSKPAIQSAGRDVVVPRTRSLDDGWRKKRRITRSFPKKSWPRILWPTRWNEHGGEAAGPLWLPRL